ncbi:MAG: molybdopterin-binding protein [Aestuariivita sp.]|nr:molybdopterin-binding protein [Aestuariivita sp.]
MQFGTVPVSEALGSILAHSLVVGTERLRKGLVLTETHIAHLNTIGVREVVVARLGSDDLHENQAADVLAAAVVPDPDGVHLRATDAFTGRVNFIATQPGVVVLDVLALEEFNSVDPMISIATVPQFQQVAEGNMVATIKIISYGVDQKKVAAAQAAVNGAIQIAPPIFSTASIIETHVEMIKRPSKGVKAIEGRIRSLGLKVGEVRWTWHSEESLASMLAKISGDILLILTASATSDVRDVAPSAVRLAGGRIDRFGMPVDPGNLLFLGSFNNRPVIGLPGCARSPVLNGTDWVLSRVACGIEVSSQDIAKMGVGGLLKEIPSRPQPRRGGRNVT